MDLMSIGEFARRSGLSPKALRLYEELGLLPPARVDDDSGYCYYAASQLDRARLIAALRELQISLAEIKLIASLRTRCRRRPDQRALEDGRRATEGSAGPRPLPHRPYARKEA